MRMAVVAPVALIVGALLAWWMVDQAMAQPDGREAGERPALFLANESLPPMNFMKHGKPTGIVIDLAEALAKRMHRPVEIRLMNWAEAQQLVLDGRADALLQINPNPERLRIYDFSEPLLTSEFTIFTSADRLGVASMRDLRGLKVGVEKQGLPISLLQEDPQIIVEIIPDFIQGFKMLATGTVDAVVADRWVGSYVLAENNIRGVKLIEEPISRSHSAIAVKKGNENLLRDINSALADIRRDGTYDRIIKSWRSKEVVFKTREQLRQQAWLIAAITVARWTFFSGVFTFPWRTDVHLRWIYMTVGFTAMAIIGLVLKGLAASLSGIGGGVAIAMFTLPIIWISMLTFSFSAACCLCVLESTAAGLDRVEGWPDPQWKEWMGQMIYVGWVGAIPLAASYGVARLAGLGGAPVGWVFAGTFFVLYPIALLSVLEANSIWVPLTLPIVISLFRWWWAWLTFYFLAALLAGGLVAVFLYAASSSQDLLQLLLGPLVAAAALSIFDSWGASPGE